MENVETDEDTLNSIDSSSTNPIPVIYQSGYLTIKDYDREFGTYYLGFPNREVDEGFMKFLLPFYTDTDKVNDINSSCKILLGIQGNIVVAAFRHIKFPFQTIMVLLMSRAGERIRFPTKTERRMRFIWKRETILLSIA